MARTPAPEEATKRGLSGRPYCSAYRRPRLASPPSPPSPPAGLGPSAPARAYPPRRPALPRSPAGTGPSVRPTRLPQRLAPLCLPPPGAHGKGGGGRRAAGLHGKCSSEPPRGAVRRPLCPRGDGGTRSPALRRRRRESGHGQPPVLPRAPPGLGMRPGREACGHFALLLEASARGRIENGAIKEQREAASVEALTKEKLPCFQGF